MGLISYAVAGVGFLLIGALESLLSASQTQSPASSPPNPITPKPSPPPPPDPTPKSRVPLTVTLVSIAIFAFLFISNALVSLIDALNSKDRIGSVLQMEIISIALLFLLYSLLGLFGNLMGSLPFPSPILSLVCLFAFLEEFFLFYLQRKDPSGIENRYFDLLLVPIAVCVCSTLLELKNPESNIPRLARGLGLISQGTWFLQMGVSFFTDLVAHGCSLHEKSRGNYTVKCKGHPDYHRGRAIATLQFNFHLAFVVVLAAAVYSIVCRKDGRRNEFLRYRPLGAEMRPMDQQSRFTLDSDEEDELREEGDAMKQKDTSVVADTGVNGYGSHH